MELKEIKQVNVVDGVQGLVKLVEDDIRNRGLVSGDRYLYAKEVADLFGVNQMMAHRALKVLADSELLIRRPRSGTFVGPKFRSCVNDDGKVLKVVHVMMALDYRRNIGVSDEAFLEGISAVSPGTAVQIHFVPDSDPLGYTKHVVNQIELGGAREGLIFIRSTEQVQRYVQEKNLIAAVFGSVYPGITELPWLDVDQAQDGKLMASYAIEKGCQEFLVLMYNQWRRGDNVLLNSITSELGRAGLGFDCLNIHSLPDDRNFMLDDLRQVLSEVKLPIAVLCRSQGFVNAVIEVSGELGLEIGKDICLVSGAHLQISGGKPHAFVAPELSAKKQVEILVKMLIDKATGKKMTDEGFVVPVVLRESVG